MSATPQHRRPLSEREIIAGLHPRTGQVTPLGAEQPPTGPEIYVDGMLVGHGMDGMMAALPAMLDPEPRA